MKYNIIINNEYVFPLFFWDGNQFRMSNQLDLATADFLSVKNAIKELDSFAIVDSNNLEVARFNNYDKCTSINYVGHSYSPQREEFCDEIVVSLTKTELEQKVKDLEAQVEDLQAQIDELKPKEEVTEEQIEWTDLPIEETVEPVEESVEESVDSATASDESSEEPLEEITNEQNDGAGAEYE